MAVLTPDGGVMLDADELKNLAGFVHGDEALLEEVNDLLQEVFDKAVEEEGEEEEDEGEEKDE